MRLQRTTWVLRRVWLFATPGTVPLQPSLSTEFSKQEYWSGLPFPPPGNLPHPGIQSSSPTLAGGYFTTAPPGKPKEKCTQEKNLAKSNCSCKKEASLWEHIVVRSAGHKSVSSTSAPQRAIMLVMWSSTEVKRQRMTVAYYDLSGEKIMFYFWNGLVQFLHSWNGNTFLFSLKCLL